MQTCPIAAASVEALWILLPAVAPITLGICVGVVTALGARTKQGMM